MPRRPPVPHSPRVAYANAASFFRDGRWITLHAIMQQSASVVPREVVYVRMRRGWSIEQATTRPSSPLPLHNPRQITAFGETKDAKAWAADARVSVGAATLRTRLKKKTFPTTEECLTAPAQKGGKKRELPRVQGLREEAIRQRLRRNTPLASPLGGEKAAAALRRQADRIREAYQAFVEAGRPHLELPDPPASRAQVALPSDLAARLTEDSQILCLTLSQFATVLALWWFGEPLSQKKEPTS